MALSYINSSTTVAATATLVSANTMTIIAESATRVSTGGAALANLPASDNCKPMARRTAIP
jgi:hypothetical protein